MSHRFEIVSLAPSEASANLLVAASHARRATVFQYRLCDCAIACGSAEVSFYAAYGGGLGS
jgi:hypothetical protein